MILLVQLVDAIGHCSYLTSQTITHAPLGTSNTHSRHIPSTVQPYQLFFTHIWMTFCLACSAITSTCLFHKYEVQLCKWWSFKNWMTRVIVDYTGVIDRQCTHHLCYSQQRTTFLLYMRNNLTMKMLYCQNV